MLAKNYECANMKRYKAKRTLSVLILSCCALIAARAFQTAVVFANPVIPRSARVDSQRNQTAERSTITLEALLADPLFKLDPNASNEDVVNAATELVRKYNQCLNDYTTRLYELYDNGNSDLKKHTEKERRSREIAKTIGDDFYSKFDAELTPRLMKLVEDDDFALADGALPATAVNVTVQALRYLGKDDEIAKIHEREVERYQNVKKSGDDVAIQKASRRLLAVDNYYLSSFPIVSDGIFGAQPTPQEKTRAAFVELGDKLAEEVKRDPFLVGKCDMCFVAMISVDEDLAFAYRDKFRNAISQEEALEAYKAIHGHEVYLNNVAIYRDDNLDESLFDFPEKESKEFYVKRQSEISRAIALAESAPVRKSVKDAYKSKASVALVKIALRLADPTVGAQEPVANASDYNGNVARPPRTRTRTSTTDFAALEKIDLTAESAPVLKQAIEDETAKGFNNANVVFLDVARAVLLKYELEVAVRDQNADAAKDVCEQLVRRADFSHESANMLLQTLTKFTGEKNALAEPLVNLALAKAEVSNGNLASYMNQFMQIKAVLAQR